MSRHSKLRKKLYVSKTIQGRILLRVTAYWILYHVVLFHVLFLSSGLTIDGSYASFFDAYADFFWRNSMLLLCAAAVFPIIFRDMLRMTNRVVGPFIRIERTLKAMTEGRRVEPLTVRKRDLVHEFVTAFNNFIEYWNRERAQHLDKRQVGQGDEPQDDERGQLPLPPPPSRRATLLSLPPLLSSRVVATVSRKTRGPCRCGLGLA